MTPQQLEDMLYLYLKYQSINLELYSYSGIVVKQQISKKV